MASHIEVLPPLFNTAGEKVVPSDWEKRRSEIKDMLEREMYGHIPAGNFDVQGKIVSSEPIYDGAAIFETVELSFGRGDRLHFPVNIARPNDGNRHRALTCIAFLDQLRSPAEHEAVVNAGLIVATFLYESLAPDNKQTNAPIYSMFAGNEVKAIALWAFCNKILIDWLDQTGYAISNEYITTGHSRNGKAALCAGIYDERIRITVPNNSGCGGCGCFRYLGSTAGVTQDKTRTECLERITSEFPHWFSKNLTKYYDNLGITSFALNEALPFDLHFNKALIAPRILYSLEADGDEWANPYGSMLTFESAKPVFELYGVPDHIGFIRRDGGHEFNEDDWNRIIEISGKFPPVSLKDN